MTAPPLFAHRRHRGVDVLPAPRLHIGPVARRGQRIDIDGLARADEYHVIVRTRTMDGLFDGLRTPWATGLAAVDRNHGGVGGRLHGKPQAHRQQQTARSRNGVHQGMAQRSHPGMGQADYASATTDQIECAPTQRRTRQRPVTTGPAGDG